MSLRIMFLTMQSCLLSSSKIGWPAMQAPESKFVISKKQHVHEETTRREGSYLYKLLAARFLVQRSSKLEVQTCSLIM